MTLNIGYKPSFIRQFNKLPKGLQDEVLEKIELFKNTANHQQLKVHKLKGRLKKFHGFSIDFKNRVVFEYITEDEVALLAFGDHEVYKLYLA